MELQLDATITVFIDLLDQLNMFRANICPSSGAQELVFYNIWYNVLLCGRQGFPILLLVTTSVSVFCLLLLHLVGVPYLLNLH
jgi:hypothetical protein